MNTPFWNQVVDIFNNQFDGDNRNKNIVTGKWKRLNNECQKLNAIYKHLHRTSRENDSDHFKNAKNILNNTLVGEASNMFTSGAEPCTKEWGAMPSTTTRRKG